MFTILELGPRECRGPLTAGPPHFFCGAPAAQGEPYCPECKARYHRGKSSKSLRALEAMIYGTDRSITLIGRARHTDGRGYVRSNVRFSIESMARREPTEHLIRLVGELDQNGE
jgi:hypothetical protein